MFYFLAMLATIDLGLSTATIPKMLGIFWFGLKRFSLKSASLRCFHPQLHWYGISSPLGNGLWRNMWPSATPSDIALSSPTGSFLQLVLVCWWDPFISVIPFAVFLILRLPFCDNQVIPHTYCEHMGLARLSCASIKINIIYGLGAISILVFDIIAIALSLCWDTSVLFFSSSFSWSTTQVSQHMWFPCLRNSCLLYTSSIFLYDTSLWQKCPPLYSHTLGQSLCYSATNAQPCHIRSQNQADLWPCEKNVITKIRN